MSKIQHLRGLGATLCGIELFPKNIILPRGIKITPKIANSFRKVTCKRCMKSCGYKKYLAGKFKEKP